MTKPKTLNGVLLRGALVVLIAALTALISGLSSGTAPLILACTVVLQGLIALRGFVDQSLSDVPEQGADAPAGVSEKGADVPEQGDAPQDTENTP